MGNKSNNSLDCVIVGHYNIGFNNHEQMTRARGIRSGFYRNLEMDYIIFNNQKLSHLGVFNYLKKQQFCYTEIPQVAPIYLCSFLLKKGFHAETGSFFPSYRDELNKLIEKAKVVAVTTTLYLNPITAIEVVAFVRKVNPNIHVVVGGPLIENLHYYLEGCDFQVVLDDIDADTYILEKQGEQTLAHLLKCCLYR